MLIPLLRRSFNKQLCIVTMKTDKRLIATPYQGSYSPQANLMSGVGVRGSQPCQICACTSTPGCLRSHSPHCRHGGVGQRAEVVPDVQDPWPARSSSRCRASYDATPSGAFRRAGPIGGGGVRAVEVGTVYFSWLTGVLGSPFPPSSSPEQKQSEDFGLELLCCSIAVLPGFN